jgi:hypothetical protein
VREQLSNFADVCRISIVFVPMAIRNPTDPRPYADYDQWKQGITDRLTRVRQRAGVSGSPKNSQPQMQAFSFSELLAQRSGTGLPGAPTGSADAGDSAGGHEAPAAAVPEEADDEEDHHTHSHGPLTEDSGEIFKEGILGMRPPHGGECSTWPKCLFRLKETSMVAIKFNERDINDTSAHQIIKKYIFSPSSSAFETNLGEHTFELVSSNQILHVCASSGEDLASWIYNIRRAVSCCMFDVSDPLFQHALLKIDDDIMYEAHFATKQPLGVIFERSGDWAITKTSTKQEVTNITVGSVLASVNGESVVTADYFSTVNRLRGWTPPLTLTFRSVPRKEEYLLKDSRSKTNVSKRVWKKRYFILAEGKLAYKDKHTDPVARVELPLMGSGVALVEPRKIGGKNFVFKVLSGVVSILVQCASQRQMMDWAATLFHAIAIANGGSYIIDYEVDRFLSEFTDSHGSNANKAAEDILVYRRLCESAKRKLFIAMQTAQITRLENTIATVRQLPINLAAADPLSSGVAADVKAAEDLLEKLRAAHPHGDESSDVGVSSSASYEDEDSKSDITSNGMNDDDSVVGAGSSTPEPIKPSDIHLALSADAVRLCSLYLSLIYPFIANAGGYACSFAVAKIAATCPRRRNREKRGKDLLLLLVATKLSLLRLDRLFRAIPNRLGYIWRKSERRKPKRGWPKSLPRQMRPISRRPKMRYRPL